MIKRNIFFKKAEDIINSKMFIFFKSHVKTKNSFRFYRNFAQDNCFLKYN